MFPIFNMPCLHNHHQPPVLHSRGPHDGEISSPAATGLAVGLILVGLVVAVLLYFWCWRQQEPRNHRRDARHRRENQRDQAGQNAAGNGARVAVPEVQQVAQRRDDAAQGQQECPLPAVPLSIHHHQHDDKHFHGDHFHDHLQEGDHIVDCPDSNNDRTVQNDSRHQHNNHHHHHHRHHHHRHHRFNRSHRTSRVIIPQDPIADFERLFRSPSPRLPDITQADLEAILNGLDIPLPNDAAQRNANAQEQGATRRDDESEERRNKRRRHHHHHRHHHFHHRQKRVVIH
ncbi:hypothetical protein A9Z42_0084400 [Trichoderma parareesei]|uniref:Uncharacterized protein n=1 Tax=Trichoderma parareesei TaxID=858221 RepID=A0A2H2ZL76_TRIPA|nr:hypothetical protein A9Z42_0084400 [Trichoderma parareesei]